MRPEQMEMMRKATAKNLLRNMTPDEIDSTFQRLHDEKTSLKDELERLKQELENVEYSAQQFKDWHTAQKQRAEQLQRERDGANQDLAMYKSLQNETLEALKECEGVADSLKCERYELVGKFGLWLDENPSIRSKKAGDVSFYVLASVFTEQINKE